MTARRVHLLADFGKGPVFVCSYLSNSPPMGWIEEDLSLSGETRAWWLVEAESADAARRAIVAPLMVHSPPYTVTERDGSFVGHILASGGGK